LWNKHSAAINFAALRLFNYIISQNAVIVKSKRNAFYAKKFWREMSRKIVGFELSEFNIFIFKGVRQKIKQSGFIRSAFENYYNYGVC